MAYGVGIDLGATRIKGVCISPEGELLARHQFDTGDSQGAWVDRIKQFVVETEFAHGRAGWIGLAAPGLADADGRTISWMQGRLAAIQGFDWTARLGRETIVAVLNDAHAALIAESWRGAAVGARNAVLLTLGSGVGGAILCDGRLLRGHLGRAGHLGHLSLNPDGSPDIVKTPGSLEDAIGEHTLALRSSGRFTSTAALVAAYLANDENARVVWLRSVKSLAAGLASIINIVDPEVVVVGGGIARAGPALFDPLARFMKSFEWRPGNRAVRIVPAALGEYAGAIGAARHAMSHGQKERE